MTLGSASAAIVVALLSSAGSAHAGVQVGAAWSRPAVAGLSTGVVYMTLLNHGPADDRLIGADSPKAARVSLHRSSMTGGVMTMQAVQDGLDLPAGRTRSLAPDGYHLMLEGLKGGLRPGERYPLTVRFAHSPSQTVEVEVRTASAMAGMN